MMLQKRIIALSLAATSLLQARAQTKPGEFVVNGKYNGPAVDVVYFGYTNDNDQQVKDSSVLKNGAFTFKGSISEPRIGYIYPKVSGNARSSAQFFLEPQKTITVKINGDFNKPVVTGSATQKEYEQLQAEQEPIRKQMEPLSAQYSVATKAYNDAKKNNAPENELDTLKYRAAAIHDQFTPYNERMKACTLRFFEKHPASVVTAFYLRFYVTSLSLDSLKLFYNRLGKTQQTGYGKLLAGEIAKLEGGSPGSMAKNFTTTDINGKQLSLADFKGRYVLVDFWASWCVPCRKGNPHLKELYTMYKPKGLEIIGISDDDRDHEAWRKAVEKDGLPWRHVLRGMKFDPVKGYDRTNDISDLFGVHSLPTQILIDPTGKIVGRYDEGAASVKAMDTKLAEVFKDVALIKFSGTADPAFNGEEIVIYNRAIGVYDSVTVQNGQFTITALFKEPNRYMFYSKAEVKKKKGYSPWGILITKAGEVNLKMAMDSIQATVVTGAPENELYNSYAVASNEPMKKIMSRLSEKDGADVVSKPDANDPRYKELVADYQALVKENQPADLARLEQFIATNKNSFAALYVLSVSANGLDAAKLESMYELLGAGYKTTSFGQRLADKIQSAKITAIGKTAPEFQQPDTLGNMVKLSDFRGKYVLVDFWASWCGPCRQENPHVVKAFTQYKDKGFTVLGVSLDKEDKKDAWLGAIHKDGLTWTHVSDLKFWDNAVAKLYGINAIPQNFLLDPKGTIIATNVRGEELNKKLAEIFKM
ncbi:MAG TPA: redoxin domain-containing protein [Niastella sp.]